MRVLFAVSNDKMTEAIVKQYEKQYKEIITYKNVYYFNAILKELQRDKSYDRIVISEDLEQYTNSDYEQMDNFIFGRLDSISDEASNVKGEDIPIILICEERRSKGDSILIKIFGIGIYNAIIGTDRSINEVCRLINRPRSKKEAKLYYKIDSEDVNYEKNDENDVSELEIQNILAHYKKIGNDEQKILDSFDSIATQYNNIQLKIICKFLPLNVKAVLEEKSSKYLEIFAYGGLSNDMRVDSKEQKKLKKYKATKKNTQEEPKGTSEIMLETTGNNLSEPVVIPSAMSSNQKKIIKTSSIINNQEEKHENYENMEENNLDNNKVADEEIKNMQEIEIEQPVKRGRGRPKKIVTEPVEQLPKRRRGRPRKNEVKEEENILPGFSNIEDDENNSSDYETDSILPGFETSQYDNKKVEEENDTFENVLPGFETSQYGNKEVEEKNNTFENVLPGFEQDDENDLNNNIENILSQNDTEVTKDNSNIPLENYNNVNLYNSKKIPQYEELDINRLLMPNQKIVSFVGTSKNGTSFLVNNVAEILSMNNVNTAILDLTQNRNAYYIYTRNEDDLREKSNYLMRNLVEGRADGLKEHRNLTIYTSAFENDTELTNVEPIIETLARNHTVVLLDCDFTTPMKYFKYAQEIYLVQSMDILTIQPLTAFLRKLSDKGMLEESKVRVILNKFMRTKQINEELLIGGISIYNDASMTVRKELFNRRTVPYITIPFEMKTYLRYLDGLVVCDVSLKGYSKEFMQSLKQLANMIYNQGDKSKGKYKPPSIKNNTFSTNMSDTLNQMRQSY